MLNKEKKEEVSKCCGAEALYYTHLPDFPKCKKCAKPFIPQSQPEERKSKGCKCGCNGNNKFCDMNYCSEECVKYNEGYKPPRNLGTPPATEIPISPSIKEGEEKKFCGHYSENFEPCKICNNPDKPEEDLHKLSGRTVSLKKLREESHPGDCICSSCFPSSRSSDNPDPIYKNFGENELCKYPKEEKNENLSSCCGAEKGIIIKTISRTKDPKYYCTKCNKPSLHNARNCGFIHDFSAESKLRDVEWKEKLQMWTNILNNNRYQRPEFVAEIIAKKIQSLLSQELQMIRGMITPALIEELFKDFYDGDWVQDSGDWAKLDTVANTLRDKLFNIKKSG